MQREDVYTDSPPAPPGGEPLRRPRGGGFPFSLFLPVSLCIHVLLLLSRSAWLIVIFFFMEWGVRWMCSFYRDFFCPPPHLNNNALKMFDMCN